MTTEAAEHMIAESRENNQTSENTVSLNDDAIINEAEDLSSVYELYKRRFQNAYTKSIQLFEHEQAQRQTLYYYQRRNNAILGILDAYEESSGNQKTQVQDPVSEIAKIDQILARSPVLAPELSKVKALLSQSESDISGLLLRKRHLLDLYINESVPELINDDVASHENNPQSIHSWAKRNYPDLISVNFKPINFTTEGLAKEYIGNDLKIAFDLEDTSNLTNKPKGKRKITDSALDTQGVDDSIKKAKVDTKPATIDAKVSKIIPKID